MNYITKQGKGAQRYRNSQKCAVDSKLDDIQEAPSNWECNTLF
jgi:hypothetical protein